MRFRLEKIGMNEGHRSAVSIGRSIEGSDAFIKDYNSDTTPVALLKLSDLKAGYMVIVHGFMDYIKTSPVSEIISSDETELVFKTDTSTYKLEIINEE